MTLPMRTCLLATAALSLVVGLAGAQGDKPAKPTVIHIEDMECPVCAKTIVKSVQKVTGVESAKGDPESTKMTVVAKKDAKPSPKALWEAVVKAGFKPTRLETPEGTFEEKPKEGGTQLGGLSRWPRVMI